MGVTTSTNGKGRTIVESIRNLVVGAPGKRQATIELALGPRPVDDFLVWWGREGKGYQMAGTEFRGHDAMPIGDGCTLRPEATDGLGRIADRLSLMNIRHYSMHPPDKKVLPTLDSLVEWYLDKRQIFQAAGTKFALETMYFNPHRPHNLVSLEEVHDFAARTASFGVVNPLVLDLAHIRINVEAGKWPSHHCTNELLRAASPWMEIHVSSNNGNLDQHRPYEPGRDRDIDTWLSVLPRAIPRISEGRVR